jgi:hypothetical protein
MPIERGNLVVEIRSKARLKRKTYRVTGGELGNVHGAIDYKGEAVTFYPHDVELLDVFMDRIEREMNTAKLKAQRLHDEFEDLKKQRSGIEDDIPEIERKNENKCQDSISNVQGLSLVGS